MRRYGLHVVVIFALVGAIACAVFWRGAGWLSISWPPAGFPLKMGLSSSAMSICSLANSRYFISRGKIKIRAILILSTTHARLFDKKCPNFSVEFTDGEMGKREREYISFSSSLDRYLLLGGVVRENVEFMGDIQSAGEGANGRTAEHVVELRQMISHSYNFDNDEITSGWMDKMKRRNNDGGAVR